MFTRLNIFADKNISGAGRGYFRGIYLLEAFTPRTWLRRTFFLKKCVFLKIWHSKSGYRQLRRPKSLPRMRFSSLYDASPPRNITVCVFDLDLGRKKTSLRKGAPDLSKKKQKCKLISYQYYKIFVLKSQQKPSGK